MLALGRVANAKAIVRRCYGRRLGCVYCGSQVSGTADHVVPQKHGGRSLIGNLVPACAKCNQQKKALMPAEFFQNKPSRARMFLERAIYADPELHELARRALRKPTHSPKG